MTRKYKDVKVNYTTIEFETRPGGLILARAPSVTSQFIGAGNTKKEALADALISLNLIEPQ